MCGLFGVVLPATYPDVALDACLLLLGRRSEERGRDAAGLGLLDRDGDWTVAKTVGGFQRLTRRRRLVDAMGRAVVALGHTRWATQGGLGLAQASPIAAGALLGTHNGDIEITSIPGASIPTTDPDEILQPWLTGTADETDSHHLFAALAARMASAAAPAGQPARSPDATAESVVELLTALRGRAALVWTDTSRPDRRVWLARAGLSPLAVGLDRHGALWWASNPGWLRDLSTTFGLRLRITLLAEGTLWVATPHQAYVECRPLAEFKPTVRWRDLAIARNAAWRGFDPADEADDHLLLRHRTVA